MRTRLLMLFTGSIIVFGSFSLILSAHSDDPKVKSGTEIVLKDDVKAQLQQALSDAASATQAYNESKALLTDPGNACETTVLKRFDTNRAAKVNAWQALEVGTRYLLKVDPEWELDLKAGKYHPKVQAKP